MISAIIIIFSFILDGLLSIYKELIVFNILSFKPMFTIVSLVLVFPFYHKPSQPFYKVCIITGLIYDLLYTNTLILNALIFLLIGFIIHKIYYFFSSSLISGVMLNLIIISFYHLISYIILFFMGYLSFNIIDLSYNFLGILITNTIYYIIIFLLVRFLNHNKHVRDKYSL